MPSCRCQVKVFDNITNRNRLCKNKKKFNNLCFIHAKKYIILIQSYFKAQLVRKKLFYYKKLPCDLQKKIIWHMREDIYLKCLNNSIIKIIYNKSKKFLNSINLEDVSDNSLLHYKTQNPLFYNGALYSNEIIYEFKMWNHPSGDFKYQNGYNHTLFEELNNIIKLLNKYSLIINTDLINIIDQFTYIIAFIINKNEIFNIFDKIPEEYREFSKICSLLYKINQS